MHVHTWTSSAIVFMNPSTSRALYMASCLSTTATAAASICVPLTRGRHTNEMRLNCPVAVSTT